MSTRVLRDGRRTDIAVHRRFYVSHHFRNIIRKILRIIFFMILSNIAFKMLKTSLFLRSAMISLEKKKEIDLFCTHKYSFFFFSLSL